jgi:flagellar biosynthesis protein FlhA
VRGDAIAGILILAINLVGGIIIGALVHDLSLAQAFQIYGALTIGDGLAAQVPALTISTAAGILVTRVATEDNFSGQLSKQFQANQQGLLVAAGVLGVLGLLPGMPHAVFLAFALGFGGIAWLIRQQQKQLLARSQAQPARPPNPELAWTDVPVVEPLALELPYRLIQLVDKGEDSELIKRIRAIRRKFINEVGFLTPSVHIRDNLQLPPETYRFLLYGAEVGRSQCLPDRLLAIAPEGSPVMPGVAVRDPSFGMAAAWIERSARDRAIGLGHTVVEPSVMVATHLDTLTRRHASELLGRQETQDLVDNFKISFPKLVEDVVPKVVPIVLLQRLMQLLLEEGVPIKDLRSIIEVAAEHAPRTQEPLEILPHLRLALRRAIVQQIFPDAGRVRVLGVQPEFEHLVEQALGGAPAAPDGAIEPSLMKLLVMEIAAGVDHMESLVLPPVIVCNNRNRLTFSRIVKKVRPQASVLALNEFPLQTVIQYERLLCSQAAPVQGN